MIRIERDGRAILISDQISNYTQYITTHFDSVFGQTEPSFRDGFWVNDFSGRKLHHYQNGPAMLIQSLPEEQELIPQYFRHYTPTGIDLAFDLGAYCGRTSFDFAQRFKRVIAVEPDPCNEDCLSQNLRNLGVDNVLVLRCAVTPKEGNFRFFSEGTPGSRIAKPEYVRPPFVDVKGVTFSDLCAWNGVPDFVKMDIEGAEVDVLREAEPLLRKTNISFAIDTHHTQDFGTNARSVETILRGCGYQVETDTPSGYYTTWGWRE